MMRVDLRRDTITLPTKAMKEAAFRAELGDSVYGEDAAQRELEEYAAGKTGKEAALFVPSGTMGNLISLLAHTSRGDEIIVEENAHIRTSETGGAGPYTEKMVFPNRRTWNRRYEGKISTIRKLHSSASRHPTTATVESSRRLSRLP